MSFSRYIRMLMLTGFTTMFLLLIGMLQHLERNMCMGIPLIGLSELEQYTEGSIGIENIVYCGERAAADMKHNTIYISQPTDSLDHYSSLIGNLKSKNGNHSLYFVEDDAIHNLKETIRENRALTLVVIEDEWFSRIKVILTTFPILNINGTQKVGETEKGREIIKGQVSLFAGYDSTVGGPRTESFDTHWHVRAASNAGTIKKPQKLSLKKADGENKNAELLGLGSDDDWILNSMVMDDTNIREKLIADMWNDQVAASGSGDRMSVSEYVEVLINGEYRGLYLLQRRIDEKYLKLNLSKDILIKGMPTWTPSNLQEGYEIIYSPFDEEKTYDILADVIEHNRIDPAKLIDVNLLIEFCSATDNTGYKNMFYVLRPEEEEYVMSLVPWDMDITLGVSYQKGIVYNFDHSLETRYARMEYKKIVREYPDFEKQSGARWNELRKTVYSQKAIEEKITKYAELIESSGAHHRDLQKNGIRYDGKDTWRELIRWCDEKGKKLDAQYIETEDGVSH